MNDQQAAMSEALREPMRVLLEQLRAGADIEVALVALREATNGFLMSIATAMKALNISLVDARYLIETSPAFTSEHAVDAEVRRELLDRIAPQIEAARQARPQDPDYVRNDLDGTGHQGQQSRS
jgi:hypothetical protein